MPLERAFDTLGLGSGASAQEIESAYRSLCADFDARIARVTSPALRDRYAAARAELDAARAAALQSLGDDDVAGRDDPRARAWAVLGLPVGASPLEVASAYVTLCDELDRELASAPTEGLRRRCLEARAEIDAAYQLCAAAPLRADPGAGASGGYRTQVAAETFEAPEPEPDLDPPQALEIVPDPDPEPERARRRPRRGALRRMGAAAAVVLLAAGGAVAYGWSTDSDWRHSLRRLLPLPPDPALVEAQSAAEYLRRRVAEERRDLRLRADLAEERIARLEASLAEAATSEERGRLAVAYEQAQARGTLAAHLVELAEGHVFSSNELAEAYGRIQLGGELAAAGSTERAVGAFTEAREHLETTLLRLDEAESAVGARSEALAARDAWVALAASAGLDASQAVNDGSDQLAAADALLEQGRFEAAVPELRRASQSYRTALDEGRRIVAARRDALLVAERKARAEAQARAEAEARVEAERQARAAAEAAAAAERARAEQERAARSAELAERRSARSSDVAAAPPEVTPAERAEVKLVTIPGGPFLYGCNGSLDGDCRSAEVAGRRAEVPAFRIDRTEVRVNEYAHCVAAGACGRPDVGGGCNWDRSGRDDHPVNCVDWEQARAYCEWVGKRLPSEREWEKAARGTDGRTYPWGNEAASCSLAVMRESGATGCGESSTAPVASRAGGRSPYGIFDMAGNVLEWTADLHEAGDGTRVVRGGSWQSPAVPMRASHREAMSPGLRHASVGFRCARGAVVADRGGR